MSRKVKGAREARGRAEGRGGAAGVAAPRAPRRGRALRQGRRDRAHGRHEELQDPGRSARAPSAAAARSPAHCRRQRLAAPRTCATILPVRTWGASGIVAAVLAFCAPAALAAGPVAQATRVGPVPRQQQLQLVLPLNADLAGLESFAQSVNTPGSPQYGQYESIATLAETVRGQSGSQLAGDGLHARRRRHRRQARRHRSVRRRDDERSAGRAGVQHAACGVPRRPPGHGSSRRRASRACRPRCAGWSRPSWDSTRARSPARLTPTRPRGPS